MDAPVIMGVQQPTAMGPDDLLMSQIITDRNAAIEFQKPRHAQWNESIALSRDRVSTNRLIQRHPVNMPLMKENEQTWLGKIEGMPSLYFEVDADDPEVQRRQEMLVNGFWERESFNMMLPVIDYLTKKNVYYTGRTFVKLGIKDRRTCISPLDPFDIVVDPKMLPWNIETATHIHHLNIFKRLGDILSSQRYDAEGKRKLREFMGTPQGVASSDSAADQLIARMKRMQDMGVTEFMKLIGTDHVVKLTETIKELWDEKKNGYTRYVITYAFDNVLLRKQKLVDAIGMDDLPYESWASGPSTDLIWDVAPADPQRVLNKVENLWVSQLLENRTLKNYNMRYFDGTKPNFSPATYEPRPWGWYPVPGKPADVIQEVPIGDVSGTLNEMEYFRAMASRSIAVTDINKGISGKGQRTRGEIEILAAEAQKPTNNTSMFYTLFWQRVGEKWLKLNKENFVRGDSVKLSKRGRNGAKYSYDARISEIFKYPLTVKVISQEKRASDVNQLLTKLKFARDTIGQSAPQILPIIDERIMRELDLFDGPELSEIKQLMRGPVDRGGPAPDLGRGINNIASA